MSPGEVMMEKNKALWWIHTTATTMAEKGLTFHQFDKRTWVSGKRDLIMEKMYIDTAVYLYSVILKINADIVRMAIMEIGRTYSKGNLYGIKELDEDIRKSIENKTGRKMKVTGTDETVRDVINHLFLLAADKHRKCMEGDGYVFPEYLAVKDAVYLIVFHVWNMESNEESIKEQLLASYIDMNIVIENTVKEIADKEISAESIRNVYIKHYMECADERYEKAKRKTPMY